MKTSRLITGFGAIGAAVAAYFLFEPRNGAKRRKKIVNAGRELYTGAGEEIGRLSGELGRLSGGVSRGLTTVVDRFGELTGINTGSGGHDGSGGHAGSSSSTSKASGRTKHRRATNATHNGEA